MWQLKKNEQPSRRHLGEFRPQDFFVNVKKKSDQFSILRFVYSGSDLTGSFISVSFAGSSSFLFS